MAPKQENPQKKILVYNNISDYSGKTFVPPVYSGSANGGAYPGVWRLGNDRSFSRIMASKLPLVDADISSLSFSGAGIATMFKSIDAHVPRMVFIHSGIIAHHQKFTADLQNYGVEALGNGNRAVFGFERVQMGEMFAKWASFFEKITNPKTGKPTIESSCFIVNGCYSASLEFKKEGFWSINLYKHSESDILIASRKAHFHIKSEGKDLRIFHYDNHLVSEDVVQFEERISASIHGTRIEYQKEDMLYKIPESQIGISSLQAQNLLFNMAIYFGEAIAPVLN